MARPVPAPAPAVLAHLAELLLHVALRGLGDECVALRRSWTAPFNLGSATNPAAAAAAAAGGGESTEKEANASECIAAEDAEATLAAAAKIESFGTRTFDVILDAMRLAAAGRRGGGGDEDGDEDEDGDGDGTSESAGGPVAKRCRSGVVSTDHAAESINGTTQSPAVSPSSAAAAAAAAAVVVVVVVVPSVPAPRVARL